LIVSSQQSGSEVGSGEYADEEKTKRGDANRGLLLKVIFAFHE
jgi:hypothetical protein